MSGDPRLDVTVRQIPKLGLTAEQCEDAWAVSPSARCLAVADGASDSYASGRFARLLVEGFVKECGPRSSEDLATWVRDRAEAWAAATPVAGLPWYKQEKARLGAHCTFLGVALDGSEEGISPDDDGASPPEAPATAESEAEPSRYRALAVGDVCLFHVRDDRLLLARPVERPEDFGVQPALVATSRTYPGPGVEAVAEWSGNLASGDRLFLASDAIARWFLESEREGERPWQVLAEASDDEFAHLVARLRAEERMRNDDVTVVTLAVRPTAPEPPVSAHPDRVAVGVGAGQPSDSVIPPIAADQEREVPAEDQPHQEVRSPGPAAAPPVAEPPREPRAAGARRPTARARRKSRRLSRAAAISLGAGALLIAAALIRPSRTKDSSWAPWGEW